MPIPVFAKLRGARPDAAYDIALKYDDLTKLYQFDAACSMIQGRMIGPFGLHTFLMGVMHSTNRDYRLRDLDGRKKATKDLHAAQAALMKAAIDYDEALQDAYESLSQKSSGSKK